VATKLQRVLLWHLKEHHEKAIIVTGHKSSNWGILVGGKAYIECSECVLWGLVSNKFIQKTTEAHSSAHEDHTYQLTSAGISAAGQKKPLIKAHFTGGSHGPRWS
jgi:hypothetical protein